MLAEVCALAAAARVPVWFEPVSVPKSVRVTNDYLYPSLPESTNLVVARLSMHDTYMSQAWRGSIPGVPGVYPCRRLGAGAPPLTVTACDDDANRLPKRFRAASQQTEGSVVPPYCDW